MESLFAVKNDNHDVLGKLLYFGLGGVLIERDKLTEICEDMNLPVGVGTRLSEVDAFRSATGDIYDRIVDHDYGELRVRKIYCRDNEKSENIVSRELVCETLGQTTNQYLKLANLYYDRDSRYFYYSIEDYGSGLDVDGYCRQAEELFELYKRCVGRNQLENLVDNFLRSMDSLKVSVHGKVFFIPRKTMHHVALFEDFLEAVNLHNKRTGSLTVNSLFVADDAKQRSKMTAEFYNTVRQEIGLYMEKMETFIANGGTSPAIMDRWVNKVQALESKKKDYESLLQCELDELGDQFTTLKFLANELSVRADRVRLAKCA
jgi:hypothetical protein